MPHMYILQCADESYYVGSTVDLDFRLEQHEAGEGANYTAKRLPVKLAYSEHFFRVADAFRREKQVRKWSRAKRKALIDNDINRLQALSRKRFGHA